MRLSILGATGATGLLLVAQAVARGHRVTVLVRSPEKLTRPAAEGGASLRVVAGGLTAASLADALTDAEAVVSALGATTRAPTTLLADTGDLLIAAMAQARCRRLVAITSALNYRGQLGLPGRIAGYLFRHVLADARAFEQRLSQSALDWTVLRPPRLTDGAPTGSYRIATGAPPARSIARADLARCALDVAEGASHLRAIVGVSR